MDKNNQDECNDDNTNSFSPEAKEKIVWFESICAQLASVRELREKYDKEYEALGREPDYKRVPGYASERARLHSIPLVERYAPPLNKEQMKAFADTMGVGEVYSMKDLSQKWNVTLTETRRRCFWMKRQRFLKYSRANDTCEVVTADNCAYNPAANWTNRFKSDVRST